MNTQMTQNPTTIHWKIVVRFAVVALVMPIVLFAVAGREDWWQGWVYIIITAVLLLISHYVVYLKNPELIAERTPFTESEGIKDWDKKLIIWIAIVGPLAFLITAGLDKRFGWSANVALPVNL